MKMESTNRIFLVSSFIVLLDQISKMIVRLSMNLYDSIPVLGDFFRLTYIENRGMAFGIRFGNNWFFTVFAIVASIAILFYLLRMQGEHWISRFGLAMIFGGAIGNLLDRLIRGRVTDFLDFEFFDISIPSFRFLFFNFPGYQLDRWPVFNVADMAITIGMMLLFIIVLFEPQLQEKSHLESESEFIH